MSDPDDHDMTAAEFVLGTLSPEERRAATVRRAADPQFDSAVERWEARLAPLSEGGDEVAPPPHLWNDILRRIGLIDATDASEGSAAARTVVALHRSVRRWRGATALVTALAACLAVVTVVGALRPPAASGPALVAFLQKTDAQPAYLMRANLGERTVSVKAVDAVPPAGRSYELWLIDPQVGPPKSLGVLTSAPGAHALPAGIGLDIAARATYAVTEEPIGGSPSGTPSGAPLFVGHLVSSAF